MWEKLRGEKYHTPIWLVFLGKRQNVLGKRKSDLDAEVDRRDRGYMLRGGSTFPQVCVGLKNNSSHPRWLLSAVMVGLVYLTRVLMLF